MYLSCLEVGGHVLMGEWCQRITWGSRWVLRIELRSWALPASAFTCWAISVAFSILQKLQCFLATVEWVLMQYECSMRMSCWVPMWAPEVENWADQSTCVRPVSLTSPAVLQELTGTKLSLLYLQPANDPFLLEGSDRSLSCSSLNDLMVLTWTSKWRLTIVWITNS